MWSSIPRVAALALGISLFATGCHSERIHLSVASSAATEGISARVVDASERGRRIRVRAWLLNRSDHDVVVDRGSLGLRLANGRILPVTYRRPKAYVFGPGRGRMLKVDFRVDGDIGDMSQASLTMGGGQESAASPAGPSCTTVPAGAIIVIGGQPGVIPPPLQKAPPAETPATQTDDEDDDSDDAPATNDLAPSSSLAPKARPTNGPAATTAPAVKPASKSVRTGTGPTGGTEAWDIGGGTNAR